MLIKSQRLTLFSPLFPKPRPFPVNSHQTLVTESVLTRRKLGAIDEKEEEKKRGDDMIIDSKGAEEHEAEEEPEIVGRITRSRAKEMAKEAHSLIAEGSINLPMIQVFNITTMEAAPGNDE